MATMGQPVLFCYTKKTFVSSNIGTEYESCNVNIITRDNGLCCTLTATVRLFNDAH